MDTVFTLIGIGATAWIVAGLIIRAMQWIDKRKGQLSKTWRRP